MVQTTAEFIPFRFKFGKAPIERTLFLKRHEGKDELKPDKRTLHIVNIPQFLNKKCLKELFNDCGDIERVFIEFKPSTEPITVTTRYFKRQESKLGSKVGYVVFKRPAGLQRALKSSGMHAISSAVSSITVGVDKWIKEYNSQFIDSKELHKEIESFMTEFDKKCEEEKVKSKETEGVVDEDGWMTVTKHSKKPKIPRNESISKKLIDKQNRARAKQSLINFYKCQLRNAKLDQIAELRKKFEIDKQRVAQMKANRKFKPL